MKITRNSDITIAKSKQLNNKLEPLEYQKWVDFVGDNLDIFIWKENTVEGKKTLSEINEVPEEFKERILKSLNKLSCYAWYNDSKGAYDLYLGYNENFHWVTVNFAKMPKQEDFQILIDMANYLDALIIINGSKVVTNENLKDFF